MSLTKEETKIHKTVRESYASRVTAATEGSACSCKCGGENVSYDEAALKMGYTSEDLSAVPEGANLGLGCGAPLQLAAVQPGETLLDLGSGAGFDAFIAAREVGADGRVIGLDMTPEMVAKARANAEQSDVRNVEFRQGLIEEMPVADATVDVVISNCVINLSPDKPAVFREAFRVLRPGGRMAVSDIVLTAPLPERIASSLAAYVGCVAGASLVDDYVGAIRDAGFTDIEIVDSRAAVKSLSLDDPLVRGVLDEMGYDAEADLPEKLADIANSVQSAKVLARKPG